MEIIAYTTSDGQKLWLIHSTAYSNAGSGMGYPSAIWGRRYRPGPTSFRSHVGNAGYCGGGGKATLSAVALQEMGFTDVSVIQGGCRGWQKAGFALEPYPAPISGIASSRSNK